MNELEVITNAAGEIQGVRVNGQEIKVTHLRFEADADKRSIYSVSLEFIATKLTTVPESV